MIARLPCAGKQANRKKWDQLEAQNEDKLFLDLQKKIRMTIVTRIQFQKNDSKNRMQ